MPDIIKLFLSFLKIGSFSFGGGYAMLPLIKEEIIDVHNWLTNSEFIDVLAIVEMTPGPIAINSATFLGYRVAGIIGSIVATTAVILPSTLVILIVARFLVRFKDSKYVDWTFRAIRGVVLGLVFSAFVSVTMDAIIDIKGLIISVGLFYFITYKNLHPIFAIIIAGLVGVIVY